MPIVVHHRKESFAQAYVRSKNAGNGTACYLAAGYKCTVTSAAGAASRLLRDPYVVRRIAELQAEMRAVEAKATEQAIDRLAITKERVLGQLARIAFANMLDYVHTTPKGVVGFDLARIDHDKGAAIREIVVNTTTVGKGKNAKTVQRTRVKLADPQAALISLGKHFGLFVERHHVRHDYADMNDQQLAEYIRNVATQLAQNGIDVASLVGIGTRDDGNGPALAAHDAVALPPVSEAAPVSRGGTDAS